MYSNISSELDTPNYFDCVATPSTKTPQEELINTSEKKMNEEISQFDYDFVKTYTGIEENENTSANPFENEAT